MLAPSTMELSERLGARTPLELLMTKQKLEAPVELEAMEARKAQSRSRGLLEAHAQEAGVCLVLEQGRAMA
jgi:hypothetical protein